MNLEVFVWSVFGILLYLIGFLTGWTMRGRGK